MDGWVGGLVAKQKAIFSEAPPPPPFLPFSFAPAPLLRNFSSRAFFEQTRPAHFLTGGYCVCLEACFHAARAFLFSRQASQGKVVVGRSKRLGLRGKRHGVCVLQRKSKERRMLLRMTCFGRQRPGSFFASLRGPRGSAALNSLRARDPQPPFSIPPPTCVFFNPRCHPLFALLLLPAAGFVLDCKSKMYTHTCVLLAPRSSCFLGSPGQSVPSRHRPRRPWTRIVAVDGMGMCRRREKREMR